MDVKEKRNDTRMPKMKIFQQRWNNENIQKYVSFIQVNIAWDE